MKVLKNAYAGDEELFAKAFYFAMKAHESQFRKGTDRPYIEHPIRVATLLMELKAPKDVVVAGFLHDVVEDTGQGLEEIERLFGHHAAKLVSEVTEDKTLSWEERKAGTIEYLRKAPPEVLLLSFADKLDNIRSIKADYERNGESIWNRFSRPKASQEWYYAGLASAFGERADALSRTFFLSEFLRHCAALFPSAFPDGGKRKKGAQK